MPSVSSTARPSSFVTDREKLNSSFLSTTPTSSHRSPEKGALRLYRSICRMLAICCLPSIM